MFEIEPDSETKTFTQDEIEGIFKNANMIRAKRKAAEKLSKKEAGVPETKELGTCHCKGKIIEVTIVTHQFNPMTGPLVIGPGSRSQFNKTSHSQCYCASCGLMYNAKVLKGKQI